MKDSININLDRRSFLRKASVFAVAVLVFELGTLGLLACNQARSLSRPTSTEQPAANVPWKETIVSESEAGEPLIVSGTIYAPDGRTPLEGISLFVYQTDATGRYSTTGGDNRNTRIHGLVPIARVVTSFGRSNPALIRQAGIPRTSMLTFRVQVIRSIGLMSTILTMIRLLPMKCVARRGREFCRQS